MAPRANKAISKWCSTGKSNGKLTNCDSNKLLPSDMKKVRFVNSQGTPFAKLTAEINYEILHYLDAFSLNSYYAANRFHQRMVLKHNTLAVHKILRNFVHDPSYFLNLLRITNSVISGSVALLPFIRRPFKPNDLDIYVPKDFVDAFIAPLRVKFGYKKCRPTAIPGKIKKSYANASLARIDRIFWFQRGGRSVNVMAVAGKNAVVPIFSFHSTAVMNFISSYGCYCAYPHLTLKSLSLINTQGKLSHTAAKAVKKYKGRGIRSSLTLSSWKAFDSHECMRSNSCPQAFRSLYDQGGLFRRFGEVTEQPTSRTSLVRYNESHSVVWMLQPGQFCKDSNVSLNGFTKSVRLTKP